MKQYGSSRSVVYPEDKDGRVKDANKKLKAQNKALSKKIKRLQSENKTLERAYGKSCDFMQEKLKDYGLEQIIQMINDFEYKENGKGRDREQKKNKDSKETLILNSCPECGKKIDNGYVVLSYPKFKIQSCQCGHKSRVENGEGIKRS
jgi:bisphosphoglycerate-dependent phosphoglycerate mutase